jgi:S-methylmethionine-dependent homocysteine/selenocysteine methylase
MVELRDIGAEYNGTMTNAEKRLRERLATGPPLVLDGATGTELERLGIPSELPLWSARALIEFPEAVLGIHRAYAAAGAQALTANTFRTQRRTLEKAGRPDRAGELTNRAVTLAREAASESGSFVLGSAPPLEDCFHPERVPEDATLVQEHGEHARNLAAAGVDAVLVETMNAIREAVAAVRAARDCGTPVLASFVCRGGARLLSGEPLDEAVGAVADLGSLAVGVNCLPAAAVPACLGVLQRAEPPFLVYANLIGPGEERSPEEYARLAESWIEAGARIVGGCCGTRPDHIRALCGVVDANCVTSGGSAAHELPQPGEAGGGGPTKSHS